MSFTVTPNISLIKPDDNESIKQNLPTFPGWASQNGSNQDTLDGLFRRNNSTYTVNLTASGGNPTLGATGLTEGRYARLWPKMVVVWFRIYMGGAGFAAGTGTYRINLPFAMDPDLLTMMGTRQLPIGKLHFKDTSNVLLSSALLALYDPASSSVVFGLSQGGILDATSVGQDDRFAGYFMYPTTAA